MLFTCPFGIPKNTWCCGGKASSQQNPSLPTGRTHSPSPRMTVKIPPQTFRCKQANGQRFFPSVLLLSSPPPRQVLSDHSGRYGWKAMKANESQGWPWIPACTAPEFSPTTPPHGHSSPSHSPAIPPTTPPTFYLVIEVWVLKADDRDENTMARVEGHSVWIINTWKWRNGPVFLML